MVRVYETKTADVLKARGSTQLWTRIKQRYQAVLTSERWFHFDSYLVFSHIDVSCGSSHTITHVIDVKPLDLGPEDLTWLLG